MEKIPYTQKGFTLIELILTMVILSVLAAGSVQFISFSANAYIQTAERAQHTSNASIINEKLIRLIRNALPNSIRITSNQRCIEFIPIVSASEYTLAPIIGSSFSDPEVHMVPLDSVQNQLGYGVIFPDSNTNNLYTITRNPGRITPQVVSYQAEESGASVYSIPAGFRFESHSPSRRIFFVDTPSAFCQQGRHIFQYGNYGFISNVSNLTASLPSSLPNRKLIATGLIENSLQFNSILGSLRRSGLIAFRYQLNQGNTGETLTINKEVQIRNVP